MLVIRQTSSNNNHNQIWKCWVTDALTALAQAGLPPQEAAKAAAAAGAGAAADVAKVSGTFVPHISLSHDSIHTILPYLQGFWYMRSCMISIINSRNSLGYMNLESVKEV